MSLKLPGNGFKWVEDTSQFNEDFIKSYNEESDKIFFFGVDVQYAEKFHEFHHDLSLLLERMKIEKIKS